MPGHAQMHYMKASQATWSCIAWQHAVHHTHLPDDCTASIPVTAALADSLDASLSEAP